MSLPDEFLLLAYDEDGIPLTDGTHLDNGLGGAVLLDLALAGRVGIEDKRVVVTDPSPTGDRLLDDNLARVGAESRARKPGHWVSKFAKDARPRVLDRLVADGVLTVAHDRVLGVFPRTKYPPAVEVDAAPRLRAAVTGTGPVEPRTAALCALVAATELDRKVLPGLDRKLVNTRLREIGEDARTIQEIQAAVMVAIVASTTAATAGASA